MQMIKTDLPESELNMVKTALKTGLARTINSTGVAGYFSTKVSIRGAIYTINEDFEQLSGIWRGDD
jgi:hypothetical protein